MLSITRLGSFETTKIPYYAFTTALRQFYNAQCKHANNYYVPTQII